MQIVGNKELPSQPKFGFVRMEDVTPESQVRKVPADGVFVQEGQKCQHGVYIPPTDQVITPGRALYCSICNPYLIEMKGHGDEGHNVQATEPGAAVLEPGEGVVEPSN